MTGGDAEERYESWIVEREGGSLEVRRRGGAGAPLNALLGAALFGGGVWLGRIDAGTLVSGGLFLAGGLWIVLAVLAWLGESRIVIAGDELVVKTVPGRERRSPLSRIGAVRVIRWDLSGAPRWRPLVVWKVELENGDEAVERVGFRFRDGNVARRFAHRLADVLEVDVRSG